MKKSIILFFITAFLSACAVQKPPVTNTIIEYRDTTIFKTDTVKVDIPVEKVVEITPGDTLRMETSIAKAEAFYNRDIKMLQGKLENKPGSIKTEVVYKERVITKDSLVYKEVPVEVEVEKIVKVVPWWAKILSFFGFISLVLVVGWLVIKFNGRLLRT